MLKEVEVVVEFEVNELVFKDVLAGRCSLICSANFWCN